MIMPSTLDGRSTVPTRELMRLIEPHEARAWAKRLGMSESELRNEAARGGRAAVGRHFRPI